MPKNVKTQVDLEAIARITEIHVNGPRNLTKFDENRKEDFLEHLRKNGNISLSARNVGVAYSTVKQHQRNYPEFNLAVEEAILESVGYAEAEVIRRGFEGVDKPVWYQGVQVGTEKHYSDTLAIRWLEAHAPHKWSSKSSVDVNQNVNINSSDAKNKLLNMLNVSEEEIIEAEFTEDD